MLIIKFLYFFSLSIQNVCRKTTMVLNINDTTNNDTQAEALLQIHERLQQGSFKRGLWCSLCCGVIMSSNVPEPERL